MSSANWRWRAAELRCDRGVLRALENTLWQEPYISRGGGVGLRGWAVPSHPRRWDAVAVRRARMPDWDRH